ncbi:hypothetical protein N665_1227s0005 [Sinapis alba]|nr:hypothetical protein N665_1227s0005 [Sinapis alba]KAF8059629.1 hypothetical protein N665_1227s0005 [Sinapis alba]
MGVNVMLLYLPDDDASAIKTLQIIGLIMKLLALNRLMVGNIDAFVAAAGTGGTLAGVRVAQNLGPGHTIVTILCDSGMRHLSKFHDPHHLALYGLTDSNRNRIRVPRHQVT